MFFQIVRENLFSQLLFRIMAISISLFAVNHICEAQVIIDISEEKERIDNSEYLYFEVKFFGYLEEGIHFDYNNNDVNLWPWESTVNMEIISDDYSDRVFRIIVGEYPKREQFRNSNIQRIMINKYLLEEYLNEKSPWLLSSMAIIFIDQE